MRRSILLVALLAVSLPLPNAEAAGAQWWGPTTIGQGFHIRVPVTVTNSEPYPVTNGPVAAELDLAELLAEAGWPHRGSGESVSLTGFHLDPESVRVMAMTPGGSFRAPDPIPSTYIEGSLKEGGSFNPANPHITVLFRVAERVDAGAVRHFMVYLDSDTTSPAKPAPSYSGLPAGDVDALFWSGPGVALYGYVRPEPGKSSSTIQVTGLHDATEVRVLTGSPAPGSPFSEEETFTLDALETRIVGLSAPTPAAGFAAGSVAVKVFATAPVVAQGTSAGFVPSVDGTMTGREFVFALRHEPDWEQDSVYFTRTGGRDTVVRVERITNGLASDSWDFRMVAANGPEPYTVGARATLDQGCNHDPLLDPTPGLYRARVISGDSVQMQLQSTDALSQVPTIDGSTSGTSFWAATGWSDGRRINGVCNLSVRPGRWVASGVEDDSTLRVTSPERDIQVYPPGSPGNAVQRYPPPETIPAEPRATSSKPANFPDRPLHYEATGPVRLFVGLDPQQVGAQGNYPDGRPEFQSASVPAVNGPLGGSEAGRGFAGLGSALVFAPYPGTVLDLTLRTSVSETRSPSVPIAADGTYVIQSASANDVLRSFSFTSTRPVFVYPLSASGGLFSAVPEFLSSTVGEAEFRGYLIDLAAKNGADPLFGSTTPGTPAVHQLVLKNLARDHQGLPLDDNVRLSLTGIPVGWTAVLEGISDGSSISLAAAEQRDLRLLVTPPADAMDRQQAQVRVKAESLRSYQQSASDTLIVTTFVKSSVGLGLWFDFEGNTVKGKAKDLDATGNATFDLVVKNFGSKLDPIRLLSTTTDSGWTTRILVDDVEADVIPLATNESAKVVLRVKAPSGLNLTESAIAQVVVRATSGILASVHEEVYATAQRLTASDLSLAIDDTFRFVDPGGNATFNLTLRNASGGVTVRLDARGSPAGGWKAPRIVTDEGVVPNGGTLNFDSELKLNVTVQAPANASAGLSTTIRFSARPTDDNPPKPPREAILTIRVRAVHAIEAVLPNLPLALSGVGQEQAVEVRLRNLGNLAEVLNVTVADLPSGWNLTVPPDIRLAVGASQTMRLGLKAPPGVPAGLYNVTVGILALDGNMTLLHLPTQVGSVARQRVDAVDGLPVQPGELAAVEVPVANEGNVPLRVTLQPAPGDAWRVRPLPETLLQPGEQATLLLLWEVPATSPDGGVTREARLAFASDQGESHVQSVTARFDVGRPDLVLAGVTSTPAPAGTLVQATVRNQGTRPAHGFDVDLLAGGRVVDRAHVGELPANGTVVLSLLQTEAGSARVVADSNGTVVEGLESNNARDVAAEASKDAPALPIVPSLALLALAVILARRWRPGRE